MLYFSDGALSIPGYTFEKVWLLSLAVHHLVLEVVVHVLGCSMARHRQHDYISRR